MTNLLPKNDQVLFLEQNLAANKNQEKTQKPSR